MPLLFKTMVIGKIMENLTRNKRKKNLYTIEMTDTFGGEPNYCWVRKYQTQAVSIRGAITKLAKHYGRNFRVDYCDGFSARYNAVGASICIFVEEVDKDDESLVSGGYVSI